MKSLACSLVPAVALLVAGLARALPSPREGQDAGPAEVRTECQQAGQLAVTFDDGPSPQNTLNLLKLLSDKGVKATFFLNANNLGNIMDPKSSDADIVRKTFEAGHVVASHTYGHADLATQQSDDNIRNQLCWVDRAIARIIGKAPRLFRAPYGSVNDRVLRLLGKYGYTVVHWNIDTFDWKADNTVENMVKAYTDTLRNAQSGIALQHDIHARTVNELVPAVFTAIAELNAGGNKWTYVTADTCVGAEPYRADPWQDTDANADWYCPSNP